MLKKMSPVFALAIVAALIIGCYPAPLAGQTVSQNNNQVVQIVVVQPQAPAEVVAPEPPQAPAPTEAPTEAAPTEPGTTCSDWSSDAKTTQALPSGSSALGDVEVDGKPYYDNGSGEATIVRNMSERLISIYAQWGSGCQQTTELKTLVNTELESGCGGTGCKNVRVITVTDSSVTEKFYNTPLP